MNSTKKFIAADTDSVLEALYWLCDESNSFSEVYKDMPCDISQELMEFCRKIEINAFSEGVKIGMKLNNEIK